MTKNIPWAPNMSYSNQPTSDDLGFKVAYQEAKTGFDEGGVPIGACLVDKDGKILGQGHNMRVQKSSATLHVRSYYIPNKTVFNHLNPE